MTGSFADWDPIGEIENTASEVSANKDEVNIDINFRIIQQFSTQLYDNPRRAIEELVCNSYDAGAGECYISTPEDSSEKLRVLDNGESMDMDGIEWLWTVAESPKDGPSTGRIAHNRKQIGKFGVGKLAAFALGDRLTYLATKGDTTRVISVDQNRLRDRKASNSPPFPVYEIDREDAEEHFSEYFEGVPNPWDQDWESWTLALVEEIPPENTGNQLMPWLLKRMVNSTIPISSRFKVVLNDERITETERDEEPIVKLSVTDPDVTEEVERRLESYWKENSTEYDSEEDVPESKYDCSVQEFPTPDDIEGKEPGIEIPTLGPVMGGAKIYESDLNTRNQEKQGFDEHGFKIYVRGKLLNRHEPKWGIDEIGFKWWKKFVAELEIPGLDDALLVQRDSTKRDRKEPEIAKIVAHSVYNVARRERDRLESESENEDGEYEPKSLTSRVSSKTPSQTYEAVSGLSNGKSRVDPESVDIVRQTKESTEYALRFDNSGGDIIINEEHPLYKLLVEREVIKENLRNTFGEVYASTLLLLGYLRYNFDDESTLDEAEEFFDYALRSAADSFRPITQYLKTEIESAAASDDRSLIDAVANAFHQIRFGDVNREEGNTIRYIRIPLSGSEIPHVQIKSLGNRGKVRSDDDITRLEPDDGFDHTFCVCREYGSTENERAEIIDNCPSEVTLATLDDVFKIIECHYERRFTYGQTVDILHYPGEPGNLSRHVQDVWNQTPDKELVYQVLTKAHELQEDPAKPDPSIGGLEMMGGFESYSREEISETVEALSTLTGRVNITSDSQFYLNSSPEDILEELGDVTGVGSIKSGDRELTDFDSN
jgi:hypothetical protein